MSDYEILRLVDQRVLDPKGLTASIQLISDIDKTYLETDFETIFDLARTAMQSAKDKITVTGAQPTLKAYLEPRRDGMGSRSWLRGLHFVSSSPGMMRGVLEQKLAEDQLLWITDSFKNQKYNIQKARFELLRFHISYKMSAILEIVSRLSPEAHLFLIGDNAESDPFIYTMVKVISEKLWPDEDIIRQLINGGVPKDQAEQLVKFGATCPKVNIEALMVRTVVPRDPTYLADSICLCFQSYVEVAAWLYVLNALSEDGFGEVLRWCRNQAGWSLQKILRGIKTAMIAILLQRHSDVNFRADLKKRLQDFWLQNSWLQLAFDQFFADIESQYVVVEKTRGLATPENLIRKALKDATATERSKH